MLTYITVTGPTREFSDRSIKGEAYTVPSFDDQLNAVLARLEREGAVNVTVSCQPMPREEWHVAYVSYGGASATATLDVKDVAKRTGLSRSTIQDMVHRGDLPRCPTGGRRIKIPVGAVDRLLGATG